MANVAVVGAQWGDEGKGKIVDWLSNRADMVVRFQGGHNAGHTLVVDGKVYKLALLPSGVVQGKPSIIGNGVVVDPWHLVGEIEKIEAQGVAHQPRHPDHRRQRLSDPAHPSGAGRGARGGGERAGRARSAPPGAASARPMRTRSGGARSASATWPTRTT